MRKRINATMAITAMGVDLFLGVAGGLIVMTSLTDTGASRERERIRTEIAAAAASLANPPPAIEVPDMPQETDFLPPAGRQTRLLFPLGHVEKLVIAIPQDIDAAQSAQLEDIVRRAVYASPQLTSVELRTHSDAAGPSGRPVGRFTVGAPPSDPFARVQRNALLVGQVAQLLGAAARHAAPQRLPDVFADLDEAHTVLLFLASSPSGAASDAVRPSCCVHSVLLFEPSDADFDFVAALAVTTGGTINHQPTEIDK